MTKNLISAEEHHRRPRSIGGTNLPGNTVYVVAKKHRAWHILFGNMNALQICRSLNKNPYKPEGKKIVCKFINGVEITKEGANQSKKATKISFAWKTLFEDLEFKDIISYINGTWLDPSYHFYIRRERKK